jgi:adenylate cyclase
LTGQLIESATGYHVWADKFDGDAQDVFELQDKIVESVVGAIEPALRYSEHERSHAKQTDNLSAYDLYLRSMAKAHQYTEKGVTEALEILSDALKLDPDYGVAYALAANCRARRILQGWTSDRPFEEREGTRLARLAIQKDSDNPEVLSRVAYALSVFQADLDHCLALAERAIRLNPNLAQALGYAAWVQVHARRYEEAISNFQKTIRLSPVDPLLGTYTTGISAVCYLLAQYEESIRWGRGAVAKNPHFMVAHWFLIAALVRAGREEEAKQAVAHLLEIAPSYTITRVIASRSLRDEKAFVALLDSLRRAGLPE